MHLSPWWLRLLSVLRRWFCFVDLLFIVTPIVGVCNCCMFCCTLLYVHSSIAIILMGKREQVALLNCLPGVSWWLSSSSLRCHGVVCGLWLWYFLIILTYYFSSWIENCDFYLKELRPVGLGLSCLSFPLFRFKAIHWDMIWPDCLQ